MKHISSKDGAPIAYEQRGEGPSLVLVHGAAAEHTRWTPILPELEKQFTVYAVDRRGRGQSGDVEPYAIEREYEDVVAVVDSIPGPVNLLGHSYGAICSLEASLRTSNLRKLVLYEPPIQTDVKKKNPPDAIDRINSYLQVGKPEKALLIFLREIVGIQQNEIRQLKSLSGWSLRVATAHTIPREEASVGSYFFKPERFYHMETPTLLLLGGDSPPFFKDGTEAFKRSIPNSRIAIMPGQRHAAMDTSPELFLREVIEFLTEK
jgi:pimeloyl-ACP methyl ester carboxylesterase